MKYKKFSRQGALNTNIDKYLARLPNERQWFEEWQSLDAFTTRFDAINVRIPHSHIFGNNRTKWLTEAWTLSRTCDAVRPTRLRLRPENDPQDADIELEGKEYLVQLTTVLAKNRKLGAEYQQGENTGGTLHYSGSKNAKILAEPNDAELIRLLRTTIDKKSRSVDCECAILFLYLNIPILGDRPGLTRALESIDEHRGPIAGICVLWGRSVFGSRRLLNDRVRCEIPIELLGF